MRPCKGIYKNRGGFQARKNKIWLASHWDDFFHPDNEDGPLAFLCIAHVCTCMLTTESKDAVTTAIEIPRVHMHASVCVLPPSPTRVFVIHAV